MFSGLLYLLPALALALVLYARRYPGERALVALRRRRPQARWPRPRSSVFRPLAVVLVLARGGLLIGRCLAVRPPPALSAAS